MCIKNSRMTFNVNIVKRRSNIVLLSKGILHPSMKVKSHINVLIAMQSFPIKVISKVTLQPFIKRKSNSSVTSVNLNVVQKVISKVTLQLCMKRRRHSSVTCEFRYGSKSQLKRHIASAHEGQKPYHSRSLNSYRIIKNT